MKDTDMLTERLCDHCEQYVHRDHNGYWVGQDDTSDCSAHLTGHEVEGHPS